MNEDEATLAAADRDHEVRFRAWLDDPSDANKRFWQLSVRRLKAARELDPARTAAMSSHANTMLHQRAAQQRVRDRLRVARDLVDDVVGRDEGEDPGEA